MTVEFIILDDERAAATAAGELLAVAARTGGNIALSGGKTPEQAYRTASTLAPDWSGVDLWWGDERAVPPDDDRSNYLLAKRTLLDRVARAPRHVHRMRGELGASDAAAEYDGALEGVRLQLNLLGIGPDGHTASLFPNAPGLHERERRVIAAEPGLDPWVERITMTPPMLEDADVVLFLVAGEEKAEAVARAFEGAADAGTPSSLIRARSGRTLAVLDRAAAALLEHV